VGGCADRQPEEPVAGARLKPDILCIGYGNILKQDDGLGPQIIQRLQAESFAGQETVTYLDVPQLDIDLTEMLANVRLSIFIDARMDDQQELVIVNQIEPAEEQVDYAHSTHTMDIPSLLQITQELYARVPLCYIVLPKGFSFEIGDDLTEQGKLAAAAAVDAVTQLIGKHLHV